MAGRIDQQSAGRGHAAVAVERMADAAVAVTIALRKDGILVGAVEQRLLPREIAGGVRIFNVYPPLTPTRLSPGLSAHQSQKLGRQSARLVLADELAIQRQRNRAERPA